MARNASAVAPSSASGSLPRRASSPKRVGHSEDEVPRDARYAGPQRARDGRCPALGVVLAA